MFGDAARREVLIAAGLMRARRWSISYADTRFGAAGYCTWCTSCGPGCRWWCAPLDDTDIDRLKQAGAAEVVAEIMEGSLMLASHALMLLGVPFNRVLRRIRETREQRYGLFRGFFRGVTDETGEERDRLQPRLHSVVIAPGAAAIGKTLRELELAQAERGGDSDPQTQRSASQDARPETG